MAPTRSTGPRPSDGLLVHAADGRPRCAPRFDGATSKAQPATAAALRLGRAVRERGAVLDSPGGHDSSAQDEFVPFDGDHFGFRQFRLHDLPWPRRVAPGASAPRRDAAGHALLLHRAHRLATRMAPALRYASHGLRSSSRPAGDRRQFVRASTRRPSRGGRGTPRRGRQARSLARRAQPAQLWARCTRTSGKVRAPNSPTPASIAVYPIGGWWKNNKRGRAAQRPLRPDRLAQDTGADVDLYTPSPCSCRSRSRRSCRLHNGRRPDVVEGRH